MEERKKLGWIFSTDGFEGIPYFQCPHCSRKVSGKEMLFAYEAHDHCPDCEKELHFDNVKEEDWLYIDSYYGRV